MSKRKGIRFSLFTFKIEQRHGGEWEFEFSLPSLTGALGGGNPNPDPDEGLTTARSASSCERITKCDLEERIPENKRSGEYRSIERLDVGCTRILAEVFYVDGKVAGWNASKREVRIISATRNGECKFPHPGDEFCCWKDRGIRAEKIASQP